jgi:hypothetical protein
MANVRLFMRKIIEVLRLHHEGGRSHRELAQSPGRIQPDRRLPVAQQRQDRCRQVQTTSTDATGLACFIFRFLRRPPTDNGMPSVGATLKSAG